MPPSRAQIHLTSQTGKSDFFDKKSHFLIFPRSAVWNDWKLPKHVKNIAFVQNFPNFSKFLSIWGSHCYKPLKIRFENCSNESWFRPLIHGIQTHQFILKSYFSVEFSVLFKKNINLGITLPHNPQNPLWMSVITMIHAVNSASKDLVCCLRSCFNLRYTQKHDAFPPNHKIVDWIAEKITENAAKHAPIRGNYDLEILSLSDRRAAGGA